MAHIFFPYNSFRAGQREVLKALGESLDRFKHIVLKAPTGFGKTSIAISVGLANSPTLHSVRTRNEIDPILRDLRKISGKYSEVRYSFIHSAHKMCPVLRGRNIDPDNFWINCQILRATGNCSYYRELGNVGDDEIFEIVKSGIHHTEITKKIARGFSACPFFALLDLARKADYIALTYPYIFSTEFFESVFEDLDPKSYMVIVDEAHIVLKPYSIYSYELGSRKIRQSLNELKKYGVDYSKELESFLYRVLGYIEKVKDRNRLVKISKNDLGISRELIDEIEYYIIDIKKRLLEEQHLTSNQLARNELALTSIAKALSLALDDRFEVFIQIDNNGGARINVSAVDYSLLKESLDRYRAVIYMSGTPPPKSFMEEVLDLENIKYIDAQDYGAWSPYSNIVSIVLTEVTSRYEERTETMYRLYAAYIDKLCEFVDGVKLIIYPSYIQMRSIAEYISGCAYSVYEDRDTSLEELRSTALNEPNLSIHVVAGGKVAEGVELISESGSLIKSVFVAGVPYPSNDDLTVEVIARLSRKIGYSRAYDYIYNLDASIKTLQSIGRSIRGPHDYSIVVLGDRRYISRNLRKYMDVRINYFIRSIDMFERLLARIKANNSIYS